MTVIGALTWGAIATAVIGVLLKSPGVESLGIRFFVLLLIASGLRLIFGAA